LKKEKILACWVSRQLMAMQALGSSAGRTVGIQG
jgi:hypothetical protein